ncbi:transcriptional regulator family: Fungal Specific TF [Trichoderma aggressivum f. europaeum]|uniref:Transcriptional regulator family: Fungal Specific TF n=1 Tax=Trichoderma aggressivum f. europaeum TaxID=173218 RepID=A0AAE1M3M3_9HYPO|nr:transcriptional regulator family: Fungal Specific TF [Trichoderma aggressivum f. europaeum]
MYHSQDDGIKARLLLQFSPTLHILLTTLGSSAPHAAANTCSRVVRSSLTLTFVMSDYKATEHEDQDSTEERPAPPTKRRKYTAVACDECRRRKLKCVPGQTEDCCQRCASKGLATCSYKALRRDFADRPTCGNDVVSALSQDVKILKDTMDEWMAVVKQLTANGAAELSRRPSGAILTSDNSLPQESYDSTLPQGISVSGSEALASTSVINPVMTRQTTSPHLGQNVLEEPHFIDPTSSAHGIEVEEQVSSRIGIPQVELPPPNGQQSCSWSPKGPCRQFDIDFWKECNASEFSRLIRVFQEEVESVYPCLDTNYLICNAPEVIRLGKLSKDATRGITDKEDSCVGFKDLQLARIAIATAMSIYYFHIDEDLLAWRTIGLACREALVLGLHRRITLFEAFPSKEHRELAVRVFWTIYVLDRRWSFGTNLSFALVDRDIDMELPEPGQDFAYLQCMVGYGRLCSTMWDALMPSGFHANENPEQKTMELDKKIQEWLESVPVQLRLCHPRLGLATRAQPPVLHRLRALLYLRGNHFRILIYRYYLLGPNRIKNSYRNAWLAVEIAQDSIQVLVHLNDSSDIYRRQQAAFNYFLLSALAILFLAVCNDPETFAAPCKKSFHSAIELLRHFSSQSRGSRRLWSSVRGIIPRLRRLEIRRTEDASHQEEADSQVEDDSATERSSDTVPALRLPPKMGPTVDTSALNEPASNGWRSQSFDNCSRPPPGYNVNSEMIPDLNTPDFISMSNELMGLFETFEQGPYPHPQADITGCWEDNIYAPNFLSEDQGEISWHFNELIQ